MNNKELKKYITNLGIQAKNAAELLANIPSNKKNTALVELKKNLKIYQNDIIEINNKDVENAYKSNLSPSMIDRLTLNFSAVATKPFVSFGKQEPPYAGPALKKRLPIRMSLPIPNEISSILIFDFSHKFDNSLIKVILVAKKALDAYLINSAARLEVVKNLAPLLISGLYSVFIILNIFLLFDPTIILSGNLKSLIASPSLKNSGLDIISIFFFLLFFKIFSNSSPVPTGTVDFVTIIFFP